MTGIVTRLDEHARERGAHRAIVLEGLSIDYVGLRRLVGQTIVALAKDGVTPEDVVGIQVADEVRHLVLSLAVLGLGATQLTLPTHDSHQLNATVARRAAASRVLLDVDAGRLVDLHSQGTSPDLPSGPIGEPEGRLYLRTSGTTGDMNIVSMSEAQLAAQSLRHADYAAERLLRLASIEYNNSKRHRLYCVWAGGTNVFRPRGPLDIVDYCVRHEVTCLDISRIHAADLLNVNEVHRLSDVKVRTGGSGVPYSVRWAIEERVTPLLFVRYAATECGGISMAGPGEHDEDESVGSPLDGVRVQIVDGEGRLQATSEAGHIRVMAPGMAVGYLDSSNDTARRFRDGWFYPGDVGSLREDGSLVIHGRSDEMIIFNGLNIFPSEIERELAAHPAVVAAVALGLPSGVHGQIPVAVVQLAQGSTVSERDLVKHGRASLSLRAPRRIILVDAIPVGPHGKIQRGALARLFDRS